MALINQQGMPQTCLAHTTSNIRDFISFYHPLLRTAPGCVSTLAAAKLHRAVRDILVPEGGTPCPLEHVQAMPQQENGWVLDTEEG